MIVSTSLKPPHSEGWDAWLDGYGTTHTDTLSQAVSGPSNCSFVVDDTAFNVN